jgi:hypothetical protein
MIITDHTLENLYDLVWISLCSFLFFFLFLFFFFFRRCSDFIYPHGLFFFFFFVVSLLNSIFFNPFIM